MTIEWGGLTEQGRPHSGVDVAAKQSPRDVCREVNDGRGASPSSLATASSPNRLPTHRAASERRRRRSDVLAVQMNSAAADLFGIGPEPRDQETDSGTSSVSKAVSDVEANKPLMLCHFILTTAAMPAVPAMVSWRIVAVEPGSRYAKVGSVTGSLSSRYLSIGSRPQKLSTNERRSPRMGRR